MVTTAELIPRRKQESLMAWFEMYLRVEAGPEDSNTFKAKRRDLEEFLNFAIAKSGRDHPDRWTRSLTEGFLKYLERERSLAGSTINRALATIRHAAAWIQRERPFLAGNPCEKVQELTLEDPEWRGLEQEQVERLKKAADELVEIATRANQSPRRDRACFLILLHTALRASELLRLDLKNYDGQYLIDIRRKGKKITRKLFLAQTARDALENYLEHERGRGTGPLLQSKTGNRLALQNIDEALKKIAALANDGRPKKEHVHLSAHRLRHTALRRAADKHGVHYAMKLSGHTSSKYIWRYTQPSPKEEEAALEGLF